jgi:biotin transport system substrate-specific component
MTFMKTRDLVLISFFAAVTAVLSYVKIPLPFTPVPITGQTFGVMLTGVILGGRSSFMSLLIYLLLGIVGLPVFSGGTSGPGIIAGPTGGYLWSFPIAAFVIGRMADKRSDIKWLFLANLIGGVLLVHILGLTQLSIVMKRPFHEAFMMAAAPFLPGDVLKAFLAAVSGRKLRRALRTGDVGGSI